MTQQPQQLEPTLRRQFLLRTAGGFLGSAVASLLAGDRPGRIDPNHRSRVRSVIYLFMCGGVSHIDTFDPKGNAHAGKLMDAVGFGDNLAKMRRPVIPCMRTFTRYGQSGIPVSDWFPHVGGVIDDIAVINSMHCHESNHFPAVVESTTGHRTRIFEHPTLGGWVSYALGRANDNLPAFVNMGRPSSPIQLTGGCLGASYSAMPFLSGATPIPNLAPPEGAAADQKRRFDTLMELNAGFRRDYDIHSVIRARLEAYELAARMQLAAPEVVDFSKESKSVLELYGVGGSETDAFGRQLLLARRLVESGVRFIQICHAGGGNGGWDSHGDMRGHAPLCRQTDKPIAGLLRDLKQRGLLEDTLVVWTSEFGRTPWSQNTKGRDHNPRGFTSWLAGGGVRGGTVYGETDDVGYRAVENRCYIADLQATILHQLGLDVHDMEIDIEGQPVKLVEDMAEPIRGVLG